MPGVYDVVQDAVTSTTALGTAQAAAASIETLIAIRHGRASASTTLTGGREFVQRSTGGVTPTNATEEKNTTRSPAPQGNIVTAWVTAPTLSGNPLIIYCIGIRQEVNNHWHAPRPYAGIQLVNSEQIDIRSSFTSSSHTISWHFVDEASRIPPGRLLTRRGRERGYFGYACESTNLCVKTGTGAYSIERRLTYRWVMPVLIVPKKRFNNWLSFYSGAAPLTAEITEAASATSVQDAAGSIYTAGLTESASATSTQDAAGSIYTRSLTETATAASIQDAAGSIYTAGLTESASATSTQDDVLVTLATRTEPATATDSQDAAGSIYTAGLTESASATSTQDDVLTTLAARVEPASATDSQDAPGSIYSVSQTEAITATDSQDAAGSIYTAGLTESVSATSTQDDVLTTLAARIEPASAADSQDALGSIYSASQTEAITATDTSDGVIAGGPLSADQTESATAADIQDAAGSIYSASQAETASAISTQDDVLITLAARTESASATDSQNAAGSIYSASQTETITATDTSNGVIAGGPLSANQTESAIATDSQDAPGSIYSASQTEATTAADTSNGVIISIGGVTITELAHATDWQSVIVVTAGVYEWTIDGVSPIPIPITPEFNMQDVDSVTEWTLK